MEKSLRGRPVGKTVHALCVTALLTGSFTAPAVIAAKNAVAAECQPNVATYVLEMPPGPASPDRSTPRTLRKYLDWDPQGGDANGTILDTEKTATVPGDSRIFTGGNGIIYEVTGSGKTLKSYKDNTAAGGPLLASVKTYEMDWRLFQRVWAGGGRLFGQAESGAITVFKQSDPVTGAGTISALTSEISATNAGAIAIKNADDVWMAGQKIYTLTDGEIKEWPYLEVAAGRVTNPALKTPSTIATGLTDAVQAWSPGPGTIHTSTGYANYSGTIKGYTGSSQLTLANGEIRTGIFGEIFADAAPCLAPPLDEKPHFGASLPSDDDVPATETDPASDPAPSPTPTVSGKFTLGDGTPAAGLPVVVEAIDLLPEDEGTSVELPVLGTATTSADGSWTLDLPHPLPADVQAAADANGGALNLQATATGETGSGVAQSATTHFTAAAPTPSSQVGAAVAMAATGDASSTALLPLSQEVAEEPTPSRMAQSWSAQIDKLPTDTIGDDPLPVWQTDTGAPAYDYNPYLVGGTDISSRTVTPFGYDCGTSYRVLSKKIAYTTVAEGHANWDTKASVDYDEKLSLTLEVGVAQGKNWKISGSRTLGSTIGVATGYTNQGPYFAKQWKVPIEYKKVKETKQCGSLVYRKIKVIPFKYKVPSGGPTGKYGKDVRNKDGIVGFSKAPKKNKAYVPVGSYFQLSKGKSVKWSAAASVYGFSVGATTQYDREHKQRITAGKSKKHRHDIWGKNGPVWDNPGVFYSY